MPVHVDDDGKPVIYKIKGFDPSSPEAVFPCKLTMKPGGMAVFNVLDMRPITVSPPPVAPTREEVKENVEALKQQALERERAAVEAERVAAEPQEPLAAVELPHAKPTEPVKAAEKTAKAPAAA